MRTLYENPDKGTKEQDFFDHFILLAHDAPKDGWVRGESPDFVHKLEETMIGVEITSLVVSKDAAVHEAQNKALRIAKELADCSKLMPIEVQAAFRDDSIQIDPQKAGKELFEYVMKRLPTIDDTKGWNFFPEDTVYFYWIMIHLGTTHGQKWLEESRWMRIHINWNRIDPIIELQELIDKKQKKLMDYLTKCRECWLLIGVNEWVAPEATFLSPNTLEHEFVGGFSRLYFLRNIEGKLNRLKIKNDGL